MTPKLADSVQHSFFTLDVPFNATFEQIDQRAKDAAWFGSYSSVMTGAA